MKVLDVGCGPNKVDGAIGVDIVAIEGVDIVHDLSHFPWPFESEQFDEVVANHFLEHAPDLMRTMVELHRITCLGGRIRIRAPHYTSWNFYCDITHVTPFSYRSFDHFTYIDETGYNYYSPVKFEIESRRICFAAPGATNPWRWLGIEWFANRFARLYERLFAFWMPATEVQFVLRPIPDRQDFVPAVNATNRPAG